MKLQKLGGYASIVLVLLIIAGVPVDASMNIRGMDIYDPVKMIAAYQASTMLFWAHYVMGMLNAILILLIALALRERMQAKAPNMMSIAVIAASAYSALYITTMIGGFFRNILLTGMNDASAFRAFLVLHEFLAQAAASILGWGFLMIGCAAIKTRALPRMLGYTILPFSILSIIRFAVTLSPIQLGSPILMLLRLIVFVWLGVVLLRKPEPIPVRT
jgi:hypothetical protein